jgi:DNA replication protein DnaC
MKALAETLANLNLRRAESAADQEPEEAVCPYCGFPDDEQGYVLRLTDPADPLSQKVPIACPKLHEKWLKTHRQLLVDASLLPSSTAKTHRFSAWKRNKSNESAYQFCTQFAAGKAPHWFLTLGGPAGVGKTFAAISIVWEWLENDRGSVRYYQVPYLLDQLRRGYNVADGRASDNVYNLLDVVSQCGLLVLDDLGMQKASDWATEKLDEIADIRYLHHQPMVVTTNVGIDKHPERIADRLLEGVCVEMAGASWRRRGG